MEGSSRRRSPRRAKGKRSRSQTSRGSTTSRTRPSTRRKARSRCTPFVVFALLVVGLTVVFVAGAQALVTQSSLRISELEQEAERLATRAEILRLRVADLSSPDNIVRAAEDAGLVAPTDVRILRLSESSPNSETTGSNGAASEDTLALEEGSGGSG